MNGIVTYIIRQGDTLPMIAQNLLGDATKSLDMAVFNGLDYPFISDIKIDGLTTLSPGDTLLIPMDTTSSIPTNSEDIEDFGSDLMLSRPSTDNLSSLPGGELTVDSYGDLRTVSGIECLKQDLLNRFITPLGTLPYHPEYGSKLLSMVGTKASGDYQQKAVVEVERTMRCDPRIQDVINIQIKPITCGVSISCDIISASSQQHALNLSIPIGGV